MDEPQLQVGMVPRVGQLLHVGQLERVVRHRNEVEEVGAGVTDYQQVDLGDEDKALEGAHQDFLGRPALGCRKQDAQPLVPGEPDQADPDLLFPGVEAVGKDRGLPLEFLAGFRKVRPARDVRHEENREDRLHGNDSDEKQERLREELHAAPKTSAIFSPFPPPR